MLRGVAAAFMDLSYAGDYPDGYSTFAAEEPMCGPRETFIVSSLLQNHIIPAKTIDPCFAPSTPVGSAVLPQGALPGLRQASRRMLAYARTHCTNFLQEDFF